MNVCLWVSSLTDAPILRPALLVVPDETIRQCLLLWGNMILSSPPDKFVHPPAEWNILPYRSRGPRKDMDLSTDYEVVCRRIDCAMPGWHHASDRVNLDFHCEEVDFSVLDLFDTEGRKRSASHFALEDDM